MTFTRESGVAPPAVKGSVAKAKRSRSTQSTSGVVAAASKNIKKQQGWNNMSHLLLKRFADDDPTLTAGARRDRIKHPNVAVAELDPSGRATCKMCGDRIPKGDVRLCLWLECHKGYRNLCTMHKTCFWQHPETKKLGRVEEIEFHKGLHKAQIDEIRSEFKSFVEKLEEDGIKQIN